MKEKYTLSYVRTLISRNLKQFRSLKNISQLDLSLQADVAANYINDIEKCKKGMSLTTLAKLCAALEVEPHQFFLSDDMPNDKLQLYVNVINDSVQKAVKDVTDQYLRKESDS